MDLGEQLRVSFNNVVADLISAIPDVIGALLILLIGWIVAGFAGRIVTGLLTRAGADRMLATHGSAVYGASAQSLSVSRLAGIVVKWVVFFIFLIAAANFLGWPQVSDLLNRVILFIPNLVVAALILILAPIGGRILRRIVEGGSASAGVTTGTVLGRIAEIAVIAFGVVIAVNQVGIASDLVNILFTGVVLAVAIAFGLAFGLGGRNVAEQITQSWYEKSREVADRVDASGPASSTSPSSGGATSPS
ncbi:MAG: hypothetical protein QOH61_1073 [Chloroflexota bacterium]|jgi:hypothetical protein|nr:hypothetical protein [Chloroflexota bacterium]